MVDADAAARLFRQATEIREDYQAAFFAAQGVHVERVLTDNGGAYRSRAYAYYLNDGGDVWSPTWAPATADLDHSAHPHRA